MKTNNTTIRYRPTRYYTIICIIFLIPLLLLSSCNDPFPPISEIKLYTEEDALKMFYNNKNEFNRTAKIILSNDAFFKNEDSKRTGATIACYSDIDKKYFSSEEWTEISNFFINTGAYSISRGMGVGLQIDYANKKKEIISFINFKFDSFDHLDQRQRYTTFEKIADGWYIGYGNDWD